MAWVVDTAVLIDVLEHDPEFGARSAALLERRLDDGLVICPVTYAELAPAFEGNRSLQEEYLGGVGIDHAVDWRREDTLAAFTAWHAHVSRRRSGSEAKRPIADILIGAFALRFDGLVTRNSRDFRVAFPALTIEDPAES